MKVFLDTNVLISAVATRGLCADVFREVLIHHRLIISAPLLTELKNALRKKIGVPEELIDQLVEMLQQDSHLSASSSVADIDVQDRDDLVILSNALNARAELFITGDKELLELKQVGKMQIVSPRTFWEKLKAQPHKS